MDSRWIKAGHTRDEVKAMRNVLDALKEILEIDFIKREAVRDYSSGWEYKQIAVNEYNAAYQDILKLITIEKE